MSSENTLQDLLVDELRDLYSAEQQLVKAIPKLAEAAHDAKLKDGLLSHLEQTKGHVERLEKAFEYLGVPAKKKTCDAMKGLVDEGDEAADFGDEGPVRDAAIIGAAQRVEHYEMAAYGTARSFADTLGAREVSALLQATLDEESETNKKLTSVSKSVNREALSVVES